MVENKITTYVAYLDVLGFSELISRGDEFENIFDKYVTSIKKIIDIVDSSFTYTIFSDTIILYAKDDEESSLISMTRIVSCIQYTLLLSSNIPIRGAISHGKIIHYERDGGKDRIISGPPIVEAYRYEQFQDWIGIMLTPSVLRKNKNLDKLIEIDGHNCLGGFNSQVQHVII